MSIFEDAASVCSVFNEKLLNALSQSADKTPHDAPSQNDDNTQISGYSAIIYGIKNANLAEAMKALLSQASNNMLSTLEPAWSVKLEPARSVKKEEADQVCIFTLNITNTSAENLKKLHDADLAPEFSKIQKELACKVPNVTKAGNTSTSYRIKDKNFKHLTPECFITILNQWKEAYNLKDGLEVKRTDTHVEITISNKAAKTIFDKEQLGANTNKAYLKEEFKKQTETESKDKILPNKRRRSFTQNDGNKENIDYRQRMLNEKSSIDPSQPISMSI